MQEVGGTHLSYIKAARAVPSALRGGLTQLKGENLRSYNNDPGCKYCSEGVIQLVEARLKKAGSLSLRGDRRATGPADDDVEDDT